MVKAFLSTRTDPEAEAVEYCLSGTHTVSNHKGQKFDDEVARSAIIYAFINHMADALTHLELLQVFVCAGPNTYSISREQGAKKHHTTTGRHSTPCPKNPARYRTLGSILTPTPTQSPTSTLTPTLTQP